DVAEVVGHVEDVTYFIGAHGHVVFGVGAGGDGVHAGRVRAGGQVVDQRRSRVLHDHEARIGGVFVAGQEGRQAVAVGRVDELVEAALGNRGQYRDGGLHVTHRQSQRHAVEMPGGDHLILDEARVLRIRKHQRV